MFWWRVCSAHVVCGLHVYRQGWRIELIMFVAVIRGSALPCRYVCLNRSGGELPLSQTLILCDSDWRGPGSDVTTLTPGNLVNGCLWTLMNRRSEESNTSLISAWIPLQQHFSVLSSLITCRPSALSNHVG